MGYLSLLLALAAATTVGGQEQDKTIPQPIALTGCVAAGTKPNTYILTHVASSVKPVPLGTSGTAATSGVTGEPFYWLDSPGKLKEHVGYGVEITGMLDDDIDKTEVEVKDGKVLLKTERTKTVELKEGTRAAAAAVVVAPKDVKRLSYKVKVRTVRRIGAVCG